MASGRYNTMAEGLSKIASDVTQLMATPDADLEFLTKLQTDILMKMRQPIDAATGPQAPNAGQPPMPPEIAAMMGGQMPAAAGGIPPAGGGPGAGAPNPDELRRLMGM